MIKNYLKIACRNLLRSKTFSAINIFGSAIGIATCLIIMLFVQAEQKIAIILTIFAGLTIFVACPGLFVLVTFTAEQRTKEIGIRKVLGASVPGIVQLLSKDFLKLVFVAIVIATPCAWWAMNKWLQDFAYRINITWWMFEIAGLVAIFIALFTVSFQAIKAAITNPVKSLRTE